MVKTAGRYDFSLEIYKPFSHLPSLKIPIVVENEILQG
jgi:hypothetical protein